MSQTSPTDSSSYMYCSSSIQIHGIPGKYDWVPAEITLPSITLMLQITPVTSPFCRTCFSQFFQ